MKANPMPLRSIDAGAAEFLRIAAVGLGVFLVSLPARKPDGSDDRTAFKEVTLSLLQPLLEAASSVRITGASFEGGDFFGEGARIQQTFKFSRGSATVPPELRANLCKFQRFLANKSKLEKGVNAWRGDVLVRIQPSEVIRSDFFKRAINPSIVTNFRSGLANGTKKVLLEVTRGSEQDILLVLPGCGYAEVFVVAPPQKMKALISAAISNSKTDLWRSPVSIAESRQSAREVVQRHLSGYKHLD